MIDTFLNVADILPVGVEELRARINNLLRYNISTELAEEEEDWLNILEQEVLQLLELRQEISAITVASAMHVSDRQLLRKIKTITGLSTQQYIQLSKLQLARRYLEKGRYRTVNDVAMNSGFNSSSYFSKLYFQHFGKRPSAYFSSKVPPLPRP